MKLSVHKEKFSRKVAVAHRPFSVEHCLVNFKFFTRISPKLLTGYVLTTTFQDYIENMERHSDNKKWKQWNLESTAKILEKRFPNSFVWVVRPSRYHLNTFACYQNFVETNMFGVPDHRNPEYGALKHLRALLEAAVRKSKCDHREPRFTIASSKPNCKNWYW